MRFYLFEKKNGDVGLGGWKSLTLVLLGKWCLRILNETRSLWYMVLCDRYNEKGGDYVLGKVVDLFVGWVWKDIREGLVWSMEGG